MENEYHWWSNTIVARINMKHAYTYYYRDIDRIAKNLCENVEEYEIDH